MWLRNLLFLGVVSVGVAVLGFVLYPPSLPPRVRHFDPAEFQRPEFRAVVSQVDDGLRDSWMQEKLTPAPRASDLAIARRLSLALTGTIPSLQEVRQLEAHPAQERIAWWLEGILQDRRYADYLAERLARTCVGAENGPFLVFRRRRFVTWLSDEVLANRPYDQLVRELIASKGLWTDRPSTNFITVTIEPANKKGPNPERLAGRVARAFLGVRLDCAQCHNHPFQEWKQRQFQELTAFFGQTHSGLTGIYDDQGEYRVDGKPITPNVPFLPEALTLAKGTTRRQALAAWVTDRRNVWFARATVNRFWALLFGRPLVEPVDDLTTAGVVPPALQALADDFVAHDYDLHRLLKVMVATEAFQRDSAAEHELTEEHEKAFAAFPMTRLRPEQVVGALLQAASIETVNSQSHIVVQVTRFTNERDFVKRYGDTGEDEFDGRGGTIPQRLLLMNGELVRDKTKQDLFNAAARIAALAPNDRRAIETAYLAVLTRRPTAEEAAHFEAQFNDGLRGERNRHLEDLCWTLLNSTEFSWNH